MSFDGSADGASKCGFDGCKSNVGDEREIENCGQEIGVLGPEQPALADMGSCVSWLPLPIPPLASIFSLIRKGHPASRLMRRRNQIFTSATALNCIRSVVEGMGTLLKYHLASGQI